MLKIVQPCSCEIAGRMVKAYAKIQYDIGGKLSISGVIGPMTDGNCRGSCGQCVEEIRDGVPGKGWTADMLESFCNIWDEWHLNDMRPYCEHQKELGWDKLGAKLVPMYFYTLTPESHKGRRTVEQTALKALRSGETFTPTEEQKMLANLEYSRTSPFELSGDEADHYTLARTTMEQLGHLRQEDHPDGLLCRPCPVCGYKYGTKWLNEGVPDDVIKWLVNLPDSKTNPAWI